MHDLMLFGGEGIVLHCRFAFVFHLVMYIASCAFLYVELHISYRYTVLKMNVLIFVCWTILCHLSQTYLNSWCVRFRMFINVLFIVNVDLQCKRCNVTSRRVVNICCSHLSLSMNKEDMFQSIYRIIVFHLKSSQGITLHFRTDLEQYPTDVGDRRI